MKLLIEDYPYKAESVEKVLHGIEALRNKDGLVRVSYVGYFYNQRLQDCVFFLPKVIINEANPPRVLGKYAPEDIIDVEKFGKMDREDKDFIYGLSAWIYRAVKEFQRQKEDNDIVYQNTFSRIDGSKTRVDNTLLDVILSMIEFNRRNQDFFLFKVKSLHSGFNRINWSKTIHKEQAFLQKGRPIYLNPVNKKKEVNYDEELIVMFYSILNYIQKKYGFQSFINFNFELITNNQLKRYLQGYGKLRLRQIKYKYFSDKEVMMWKLCYAFFELSDIICSSTHDQEYLLVKNFNIVFEAMIDSLLSDPELKTTELADQPDGKIVDHIYAWQGLINNNEDIYYIGDSKYYKFGHDPGKTSVYKQYTYARNVIQYNMGLFLERPEDAGSDYLIYRDEATEGYNITPNFFISGLLGKDYNYTDARLEFRKDAKPQLHYKNRLFDRDTLLLQHYDVNFLFILALYGSGNSGAKESFRIDARNTFREHIIRYLESKYQFFSLQQKPNAEGGMTGSIQKHFRQIIGKTFRPYNDQDILYLSFDNQPEFIDSNLKLLESLSEDFNIRHYKLGTDPRAQIHKFVTLTSVGTERQGACIPKPIYSFEDMPEEVFLLGGYRTGVKDQYGWIKANNKYNIRDKNRRKSVENNRSGSVSRIDPLVVSARYLILYKIDEELHEEYEIFEIESHQQMDELEMEKMGYERPNGKYIVYSLKPAPVKFTPTNLNSLIERARIEEMERLRRTGLITGDWEERWTGTPLFFTGKQIAEND